MHLDAPQMTAPFRIVTPTHLTLVHVDLEEHQLALVVIGEVDELGGDHLHTQGGKAVDVHARQSSSSLIDCTERAQFLACPQIVRTCTALHLPCKVHTLRFERGNRSVLSHQP